MVHLAPDQGHGTLASRNRTQMSYVHNHAGVKVSGDRRQPSTIELVFADLQSSEPIRMVFVGTGAVGKMLVGMVEMTPGVRTLGSALSEARLAIEHYGKTFQAALRTVRPDVGAEILPKRSAVAAPDRPSAAFVTAAETTGRVVGVGDRAFTAQIDELGPDGDMLILDMALTEIDPEDVELVRPGAPFTMFVGTEASPVAFKTRFARLSSTPADEFAGEKLAAALPKRFVVRASPAAAAP